MEGFPPFYLISLACRLAIGQVFSSPQGFQASVIKEDRLSPCTHRPHIEVGFLEKQNGCGWKRFGGPSASRFVSISPVTWG